MHKILIAVGVLMGALSASDFYYIPTSSDFVPSLPLPSEIYAEIFSYLQTNDLVQVSRSSRAFYFVSYFSLIKRARSHGFVGDELEPALRYLGGLSKIATAALCPSYIIGLTEDLSYCPFFSNHRKLDLDDALNLIGEPENSLDTTPAILKYVMNSGNLSTVQLWANHCLHNRHKWSQSNVNTLLLHSQMGKLHYDRSWARTIERIYSMVVARESAHLAIKRYTRNISFLWFSTNH